MQQTRIGSKGRDRMNLEPTTAQEASSDGRPPVTPELRTEMVSVAAYFIAQKRGFLDGLAEDDWFAAEAEIDRRLADDVSRTTADGRAA